MRKSTIGQKFLDDKRCFDAFIAFHSALELKKDDPVIETSSKIAIQCIEEKRLDDYRRYLEEKIKKLELDAARI